MSATAAIKQADIERAVKCARKLAPNARVRIDLRNQCIEIIMGQPPATDAAEEWTDDDV